MDDSDGSFDADDTFDDIEFDGDGKRRSDRFIWKLIKVLLLSAAVAALYVWVLKPRLLSSAPPGGSVPASALRTNHVVVSIG